MEGIKVAAAVAAINAVAEKFPEAVVSYFNIGFKTSIGDVNLNSPMQAGPAPAPIKEDSGSAGEASTPATTGKKRSRAAPATESTKTAGGAAEEDLFGSASGANPPKTDAAAKSAQATASPSDEDDLFGEKTAPAADKPKATVEQLRKALTECQTKHGHKDHALGVLKKYTRDGNPTISTLDEAKYQDVIDACAKYVPAK